MTFQQAVAQFQALKTIYSQMDIQTSMGRKLLLNTEFSTSCAWIKQQWSQTEECADFIAKQSEQSLHHFLCLLNSVCDVSGTLKIIENEDVADDVGLFELKVFCINVKKIKKLFLSESMSLPDLQDTIEILDPEGLETPHFYIYSAYSKELEEKRNLWEKARNENKEEESRLLYAECMELEDEIRKRLSLKLFTHVPKLKQAIRTIAQIDLCFAKAALSKELNLHKVEICDENRISYRQMFHPVVKNIMTQKSNRYQDIDIDIKDKVFLITGANMAGKTMILKTLALNQLMLQYGFMTACREGEVCLVESVQCSIGDGQNEEEGLSSFAWEIKTLDSIIKTMRQGGRQLVLIDELARTTNPVEGRKLVEGFIKVASAQNSLAVVTTHYSNINAPCRKMRVRGFVDKNLTPPIDIETITRYIDYSLVETDDKEVPTEAMNLCRLLAIDKEWIELSEN